MRVDGRTRVAAVLCAALVGACVAPAAATEKEGAFDGSCSVQGSVAFDPPVTNTEQRLAVAYSAAGTCSGSLDGRTVSNASVTLHHAGRSEGSCLGARTTSPGRGAIVFADGTTIPYLFEFQATGTEVDFTLSGARSGSARGHGTFLTARTPADAAARCAGSGNAELPMDMTVTTDGAMAAGRPGRG